jgi:hypothetical protein
MECLEDIYHFVENERRKTGKDPSVHSLLLEKLAQELLSQCRIFEEISYPARLIVEHLLEIQLKFGMAAIEADQILQNYMLVQYVRIEEFGLIRVGLGQLELSWRDGNYQYYLYPDKVELRAMDEKSAIKLFFSQAFSAQLIQRFPEVEQDQKVAYIHPEFKKCLSNP